MIEPTISTELQTWNRADKVQTKSAQCSQKNSSAPCTLVD